MNVTTIPGRQCSCSSKDCINIRLIEQEKGEKGDVVMRFDTDGVAGIIAEKALGISHSSVKVSVARWHYREAAFNESGEFQIRCQENLEINSSRGYAFAVAVMEKELRGKFNLKRLPKGEGAFYSAPTVTAEEYWRNHAARQNNLGSGRKGERSAASSSTRLENRLKRGHDEMMALSEDAKFTIEQDRNDAVSNAKQLLLDRIAQLEQNLEEVKHELQTELTAKTIEAKKHLSKDTIISEEFWARYDTDTLKEFFGFPQFWQLNAFARTVCVLFGEIEPSPQEKDVPDFDFLVNLAKKLVLEATPSAKRESLQKYKPESISPIQQVFITIMANRTAMGYRTLSTFLGINRTVFGYIIQKTLPRLGVVGKFLTALPCTPEMASFLAPTEFYDDPNYKVFGLIDGSDFPCETIRIDSLTQRLMFSPKIDASGARVMALVAPCGLILVATPPVFGRATEVDVCAYFREWFSEIPPGWIVLADRGFDTLGVYLKNYNEVIFPHFKNTEGRQFSKAQLADSKENAVKRYMVEVLFSRVKANGRAGEVVPREMLPNFSNTWFASAGLTIFAKPLKQPHGDREYSTLVEAYEAALLNGKP